MKRFTNNYIAKMKRFKNDCSYNMCFAVSLRINLGWLKYKNKAIYEV